MTIFHQTCCNPSLFAIDIPDTPDSTVLTDSTWVRVLSGDRSILKQANIKYKQFLVIKSSTM